MTDTSTVEQLLERLQDHTCRREWWQIADILGQSGDISVVQPLIATLKKVMPAPDEFEESHDGLTRKYICYALADLRPLEAVDVLIEALHARSRYIEEDDEGEDVVYDEVDHETIEAAGGALNVIGELRGIMAVVDRLLELEEDQEHYHQLYVEPWSDATIQAVREHLQRAIESADSWQSEHAKYVLNDINNLLSYRKKN
jgi:hypothetical protein